MRGSGKGLGYRPWVVLELGLGGLRLGGSSYR